MATEVLAIGATAENSADQTVVAGTPKTFCLKDTAGGTISPYAEVEIQLKDDASQYFTIATLTGLDPALVVTGAGVYRFSRKAGFSCGVFSG